mmetsp:Transcript_165197/g.530205  ORF Transcript_165197/g.530205 Transcript_165197/m.530205 type:complete len:340 (-) Transcript_165197:195-1214(-)
MLEDALDDVVSKRVHDHVLDLVQHAVQEPDHEVVLRRVLQQPAEDPTAVLVPCEFRAHLHELMNHEIDLLNRQGGDHFLDDVVAVPGHHSREDPAAHLQGQFRGHLLVGGGQRVLHQVAARRLEGQARHQPRLPQHRQRHRRGVAAQAELRPPEVDDLRAHARRAWLRKAGLRLPLLLRLLRPLLPRVLLPRQPGAAHLRAPRGPAMALLMASGLPSVVRRPLRLGVVAPLEGRLLHGAIAVPRRHASLSVARQLEVGGRRAESGLSGDGDHHDVAALPTVGHHLLHRLLVRLLVLVLRLLLLLVVLVLLLVLLLLLPLLLLLLLALLRDLHVFIGQHA